MTKQKKTSSVMRHYFFESATRRRVGTAWVLSRRIGGNTGALAFSGMITETGLVGGPLGALIQALGALIERRVTTAVVLHVRQSPLTDMIMERRSKIDDELLLSERSREGFAARTWRRLFDLMDEAGVVLQIETGIGERGQIMRHNGFGAGFREVNAMMHAQQDRGQRKANNRTLAVIMNSNMNKVQESLQ